MSEKLKVLIAASEVVPFAKTGGLADVAGALPLALEERGVEARVIMPKYACVKVKEDSAKIGRNVKVYFVSNDAYFARPELYGDKFGDYKDSLDRFAFFSREVLETCKRDNFKPDIIHCNDWQTALVSVYLNTIYKYDPFFAGTKCVFTIHNIAYQGLFPKEEFPKIGLDWSLFTIQYFEFYDKVNLMKAGLVYADLINTVSPTYAREIQTKEFGCGLEGVIKARSASLVGILNGIDYGVWNPATDTKIFKKYSTQNLNDKYVNKEKLQEEVGLKVARNVPLFGLISRLADQKGLDIIEAIINKFLKMDLQFILLGTGDRKYHILFEKVKRRYPKNASIHLKFDAVLAQKIYAGVDIFLMPSRFEPCGLGQIISFKYGTIPIVRETGGLKDTVDEFDPSTLEGSGFTFEGYAPEGLLAAIKKALNVYAKKEIWQGLVRKVMEYDYSWQRSAEEYIDFYERALAA
jgi:starch synthase